MIRYDLYVKASPSVHVLALPCGSLVVGGSVTKVPLLSTAPPTCLVQNSCQYRGLFLYYTIGNQAYIHHNGEASSL